MTREDIKTINDIVHKTIYGFFDVCSDEEETPMTDKDELLLEVNKAVCNNIKDLEQEPCEDAISRQAVDEAIYDYSRSCDVNYAQIMERIDELPTVTPKQRTGKWQEVYAETDYRNGWIEFSCENCEYQHGLESGEYGWSYGDPIPWKYCPICGARMVEPQESEDNEDIPMEYFESGGC